MDPKAAEERRQRLLAKKKQREQMILDKKDEVRIPAALAGFHKHDHSENNNTTEGKIEENVSQQVTETKPEEKIVETEEQIPLKSNVNEYVVMKNEAVRKDEPKHIGPKTQEERRKEGYSNLNSSSKKSKKSLADRILDIYTYFITVALIALTSYFAYIELKKSILILMVLDFVLIAIPNMIVDISDSLLVNCFFILREILATKQRYPFYFISAISTFLIKEYLKIN